MRDSKRAMVYSPYYKDGIGTIYFDAVNSHAAGEKLKVQIATNLLEEATIASEVTFENVHEKVDFSKWDDYYDWQDLPLTVLDIRGTSVVGTAEDLENLVLDVTENGSKRFYRVRTQLNYYGPIRFRICRVTNSTAEAGSDTASLVLVDNIIASYPPTTIIFDRKGDDYDENLSGTSVLGNVGDFDKPFLSYADKKVNTHVNFHWVTNFQDTTQNLRLRQPYLYYRWRYLDQKVTEWERIPLTTSKESTVQAVVNFQTTPLATQLVSVAGIPLSNGVGDLEYYFTGTFSGPSYVPRDYVNSTAVFGKLPGSSLAWAENISTVTKRLEVPEDFRTPALGCDYFTRIREGVSDYKWVKLCTTVTTNGQTGVKKEDIRMELVGDHTWRYHYYVPTNMVGEVFSFHFQGEEIFTNAWVAGYHSRTNTWYCDLKELPYIPYTSAAGLGYYNDISCKLDPAATHLMIEFNDELLSFSISHAAYQNFNAWTDATVGYVGHTNWNGEGAVGVSDAKQKFTLEMSPDNNWKGSVFTSDFWKESFDTLDFKAYPFDTNFDEHRTPNGWTAGHGIFVRGQRGQDEMSLQLEGRGQGWVGMDGFADEQMPHGIEKVSFRARVAQSPRFDDFAWFMDGVAFTNYAFAARVSMGHAKDNNLYNPSDISPGNPSVSLVGYYRPSVGCYEFRITRSGQYQLCAAMYKWTPSATGMKATLLASNAVAITDETQYAKPGAGQMQVKNFGNYLCPKNTDTDASPLTGSYAYLYIKRTGTTVNLRGCLSNKRNQSTLANDRGNMVTLISCTDTRDALTKGTFGVGSTDCSATFCGLTRQNLEGNTNIVWTASKYSGGNSFGYMKDTSADWAFFSNRWRWDTTGTGDMGANMLAVMPTNQTIKLEFKTAQGGDGWQPSGFERIVNSWSTNKYEFVPRVSPNYQVRLRAGGNTWDDIRTDLVVDDIEVTSWQAPNYPDLPYYNGQADSWVYTQGVVTGPAGALSLVLQPSRGLPSKAMSLRSPFLANGLSMFSFNYTNAQPHAKLLLQVCTNLTYKTAVSESLTLYPPDNYNWTTVTNWDFSTMTATERRAGTLTHYMSFRAPVMGLVRLVVDRSVLQHCIDEEGKAGRDVDYGKICITGAYCYDEPALDMRSWYAWNFHTAGWNTDDKRFGYLFDSPDGMSGSLNFSALAGDNNVTDPRTQGIGLSDRDDIPAYAGNNSFIQCPPMTNGIGSVSFRARTFETNATRKSSWVTLYGSYEPDDDQVVSPESWKRIYDFEITNTTYQTFQWKTTDDSSQYRAIRLEVANSRHGHSAYSKAEDWEKPKSTDQLQRVFLDEVSVGEPIQPRIVFRNVRPFRSGITDIPPNVVSNVADLSEQPLFGESWGIQCTIEPQQMGDELVDDSIVVYAAFKRGIAPWGYESWSNSVPRVRLDRVPGTLTFRSSYNVPESIISPLDTNVSTYPDNVWQYYVWCEFRDKGGNKHRHGLDQLDWTVPSWYYGITDLNQQFRSQGFAGYTILDTISPKRAWINEVNVCDNGDFTNSDGERQFVEIAVPRGADLTAWSLNVMGSSLNKGAIATYGYEAAKVPPKAGLRHGVDWTNDYTVVALRSPAAAKAGTLGNADGTWNTMDSQTLNKLNMAGNGALYNYESYGLELVRPSGVIEHQIIVQGTNYYAGTDWEAYGSGTNLLAKVLAADGAQAQWFFAGIDTTPATLGVFKNHGEDASCWTNILVSTPAELNKFEDGTRQLIDAKWFLQPNGTNIWIYATVLGDHIHQAIGSKTNDSEVLIIRKGASTNIVYTTDKWWALGKVTTNDVVVAEAEGRADCADNHTWTLDIKDVNETVTVYAGEKAGSIVSGVGLDEQDPYFPAIMDWLKDKDDSKGLFLAKHIPISGNIDEAKDLDLKGMYWLDIDPTEPDWAIWGGMGNFGDKETVAPINPIVSLDRSYTNVRVKVSLMITNLTKNTASPYYGTAGARKPDHLLGLEPGSSSLTYGADSPAWTSVTFKVTAALQRPDAPEVAKSYYPLRWFVFTPESFDDNFQATIDLWDPRSTNSPGWFYGWTDYPGVPIYYKFNLSGDPAWYDTAEPLKANSTYSE